MTTHARAADILIVDDDRSIRELLVELLEEEGWRIASASTGLEALTYLRTVSEPPRLILLDLMMREMNGWEFRAAQQADPVLAAIPVVAFSAANNVDKWPELEAVAYLSKPLDFDALLVVLECYAR